MRRGALSLLALLACASCTVDEAANPAYCAGDSDCAAGQRCYRNLCVGVGGGDGGPTGDAGDVDGGSLADDAGSVDAGPTDGGPTCPSEQQCDGDCCSTAETCCSDSTAGRRICVDTDSDERHCGMCGRMCGVLQCNGGVCL